MTTFWIHIAEENLLAMLDVVWWLIAMRLAKKTLWRVLASIFMAAQLFAVLMVVAGVDLSLYLPTPALIGVVVWHFFGLTLLTGIAVLYVCIRRIRRRRASAPVQTPSGASPVENSISRRNFIGACAALAPPLLTFSITGIALRELDRFRLRRFTLSLPSLPKPLDGLTIAHVSDIHVGQWTHGPVLKKIVNTTNSLNADVVVVTGDLIDYELSDLSTAIDLVKQMHGRYGLYMIEGNHDLIENGGEFEERVKRSGLSLLLDESAICDVRGYPVQFLGLRWMDCVGSLNDDITPWQVRELAKQRRPDAFPIFLAHHPDAFDAAIENGLPLTLSGHTHGGQLMLDKNVGVGPALFRYWSGFYKRGESQLIVSNGVGNTFPVRINAPAEIVHVTLRCVAA
ncbi:MAG TPA: metallophosphoesterase [Candidatus Sulfotelmatobacter sp.]|nr:metallophosphoesterase [Candidatus Sulfotelmatobacter sp.]